MNTVIGIDVSKQKLDCLWLRDLQSLKVKSKRIENNPKGHQELIAWAVKNTGQALPDIRFIMEPTGVYHETLAFALHEAGAEVVLVNPAQIRNYAKGLGVRTKNDRKDSQVLACFGSDRTCRPWQPEPTEIRHLHALMVRLDALEKDLQRVLNRQEKCQMSVSGALVERSIAIMIEELRKEIARLEQEIDDHIDRFPYLRKDNELLQTIPAVGKVLSRTMLETYHSHGFRRASQMAAYVGLNPIEYESGTSVKKLPHLSKAGPARVRAKLYMPAVVAIRYNPTARALYERLVAAGKAKKSALGAVMRKLIHICFVVLKHQKAYSPSPAF